MRCDVGSRHPQSSQQSNPELQKATTTSSAELNFFQIFRQICPVFRQIFIFEHTN